MGKAPVSHYLTSRQDKDPPTFQFLVIVDDNGDDDDDDDDEMSLSLAGKTRRGWNLPGYIPPAVAMVT